VLKVYVAFYPPWGVDDGGYSQGPTYLSAYLNWMLQFLYFLENATGIDLHRKPFFRNVGNFILYAEPFFAKTKPFGDGMDRRPGRLSQLNMYRLAQKFREPTFQWHAEQMRAEQMSVETVPADLLDFLWREEGLPVEPPTRQAHCFASVGVAAFHSRLADADSDVYLLFKSSPFGAWSHAYADQNAFYLHGFGQPLAICSGYYPWYGSDHHTQWTWQTKAHNSVLVDGEGQVTRTRASRGRIDEFFTSEHFDYCRGDATEAYGGRLTQFFRHLAYVREPDGPGWFVIADDLTAREPATFQWLLHALERMTVDEEGQTAIISEEEARLRVSFLAPEDLVFEQTDQFDPVPEPSEARQDFPNQWHLSVSTRSARPRAGFLVVLQPSGRSYGSVGSCDSYEGPYRAPGLGCQAIEAPGWLAARVQTEEAETLVAMRQDDDAGPVKGLRTDAQFLVLSRGADERLKRALLVGASYLKVSGSVKVSWEHPKTDVVQFDG